MKKFQFSLLMLLCCLLTFSLQAQQNSIFVGGTAGGNLSKFKYTSDLSELYSTTENVFGLNGGLIAGLEIQNFTLSTGVQYIQKGSVYQTDNFEDEFGTGFFTGRERLHYVSVPLLLGYRKYISDKFAFSVAIGPSFNFGLGGKIDETTEYFGAEDVEQTNYTVKFGDGVNDDYRGLQMGFQFSPGVVVALNKDTKLTFNVTWDSGAADMYSKRYKNANTFFDDFRGNQLNRSTIFSVGYERHFSFGDKY